MNARRVTMIAAVLSLALCTLEEPGLAQEESGAAHARKSHCYAIKAEAHDTWPGSGNLSTGVIRHSGLLNGTTEYVYDTDAFPTLDPDMVTFGAGLTVTTKHGLLRARVVNLFNVATGIWTSIATIDPTMSTGRFVGATGTLWYPTVRPLLSIAALRCTRQTLPARSVSQHTAAPKAIGVGSASLATFALDIVVSGAARGTCRKAWRTFFRRFFGPGATSRRCLTHQSSPVRHSAERGSLRSRSAGVFSSLRIMTDSSGVGSSRASALTKSGPRHRSQPSRS